MLGWLRDGRNTVLPESDAHCGARAVFLVQFIIRNAIVEPSSFTIERRRVRHACTRSQYGQLALLNIVTWARGASGAGLIIAALVGRRRLLSWQIVPRFRQKNVDRNQAKINQFLRFLHPMTSANFLSKRAR